MWFQLMNWDINNRIEVNRIKAHKKTQMHFHI